MVRKSSRISTIWVLFIISVLSLSINISMSQISVSDPVVSVNRSTSQKYTPRAPINITNDDELAVVATSGSGTVNDPYTIAGWNITGSTTHGISITGTTNHFRIEKCWMESSVGGIYVLNVASGTTTIINNICTNNGEFGISLGNAYSSTVTNNTCNHNRVNGIDITYSTNSTVANNTCSHNGYGIYVTSSGSSTVANNTCSCNGVNGIYISNSAKSTVVKNTCNSNSRTGIRIWDSGASTVVNNTCNNNAEYGISLYYSNSSTVANNTCNDNGLVGTFWDFERITHPTTGGIMDLSSFFVRIGLFLFVSGLLVILLLVNRHKKSV